MLCRVHENYGPVPLYVTENGASFNDYTDPEGRINDQERVDYLGAHLAAAAESIRSPTQREDALADQATAVNASAANTSRRSVTRARVTRPRHVPREGRSTRSSCSSARRASRA